MAATDDAALDESLLDDDIEVPSSPARGRNKPEQPKPKPTTPSKPAVAAVFNVSAGCRRRLILNTLPPQKGATLINNAY